MKGLTGAKFCFRVVIYCLISRSCMCVDSNTLNHLNASAGAQSALNANWKIAFDVTLVEQVPVFSVLMTVHNAAPYIDPHLRGLLEKTTGSWELVIAFDSCSDVSFPVALRTVTDYILSPVFDCFSTLIRVVMLESLIPAFETSSDNAAMKMAHNGSTFFLLVQADIQVTEIGWNEWLTLPILLYEDIFAVSARCAHQYFSAQAYTEICDHFPIELPFNRLDKLRGQLHIMDTVNRGPLALRALVTRQLGYLDDRNFMLSDDDHNLMMRALAQGWKSGRYFAGFLHNKTSVSIDYSSEKLKEVLTRRITISQTDVKLYKQSLQDTYVNERLKSELRQNTHRWETRNVSVEMKKDMKENLTSKCGNCGTASRDCLSYLDS